LIGLSKPCPDTAEITVRNHFSEYLEVFLHFYMDREVVRETFVRGLLNVVVDAS